MNETYTETKKSDWLKYLKIYHSLYRTKSKEDYQLRDSGQIMGRNYKVINPTSGCQRKESLSTLLLHTVKSKTVSSNKPEELL